MPDQILLEQRALRALAMLLESHASLGWKEVSVALEDGKVAVRATGPHYLTVEIMKWGNRLRTAVVCSTVPDVEKLAGLLVGFEGDGEACGKKEVVNGLERSGSRTAVSAIEST